MAELVNQVWRHLSDDVIIQLSRQLGAQDPNTVKRAAQGVVQLLLDAISRSANSSHGEGLMGALKRDHDGGILDNLLGVLSGSKQAASQKTMNGTGIVNHLLGKRQLEAAQVIAQMSGLDIFKSGVLMQLIAPIVMGVVGQGQRSQGLDLGGLANVLLKGRGGSSNSGPSIFEKILDQDGDGSMMDDLLNMGMKILTKR